jgi:large subunit ribosomal protein L23
MDILIRPIITEKATEASEDANCYAFEVDKRANKVEIKKAVESFYGVNVDAVRTMIVPAKRSKRYTKAGMIEGKKSSYKKAVVQVRGGEVIDLYSNI